MRTRNVSTSITLPGPSFAIERFSTSGSSYGKRWNYGGAFSTDASVHQMTDEGDPTIKGFKPCLHTKMSLALFNRGSFIRPLKPEFGGYDVYDPDVLHRDTAALFGLGSGPVVNSDYVDWDYEREKAWQRIKPQIKPAVSSLNFLYELRDIKSLFRLWKAHKGRVAELRARKGYRWLKNVSGLHLNYSFGWKPLISDIESVISSLINFNEKWNKLIEEAEKPIVRHYKRILSPASISESLYGLGRSEVSYWRDDELTDKEYSLTVRLRYRIPADVEGIPRKFLGYLDAFGLNANPWIVWEAIPYSFCVDWLFNVGDFLDSIKIESLPILTSIEDCCHSVRQDAIRTVTARESQPNPGGFMPDRILWTATRSLYDRRKTAITGVVPIRSAVPTWGQVALATSLAVTKSRWIQPERLARLRVPHRIFVPRRHTGA